MKLIEKNGRRVWHVDGIFPLGFSGDASLIQHGDSVVDCNGKGVHLAATACDSCGKIYFLPTRIFGPWNCDSCYRDRLSVFFDENGYEISTKN